MIIIISKNREFFRIADENEDGLIEFEEYVKAGNYLKRMYEKWD